MKLLVLLLLFLLVVPGCSEESNAPDSTTEPVSSVKENTPVSLAIQLQKPVSRQVFQMNDARRGSIRITGTYTGDLAAVSARAIVMPGGSGKTTRWVVIDKKPYDGKFAGSLMVDAGGWYEVEVKTVDKTKAEALAAVERVGVGLVFVTSGQSNALCSGQEPLKADDLVSTFGPTEWRQGSDPQLGFTSDLRSNGSQWPVMANILVKKLNVPVAVTLCGYGGRPIRVFTADGMEYQATREAMKYLGKDGCTAVLWHQGESDSIEATPAEVYEQRLRTLIEQSRSDAGWKVPWIIARVSYIFAIPGTDQEKAAKMAAVIAGQKAACDEKYTFVGPTTDDLTGEKYRKDGAHFTTAGLLIHGERWAESILDIIKRAHPKWLLKR